MKQGQRKEPIEDEKERNQEKFFIVRTLNDFLSFEFVFQSLLNTKPREKKRKENLCRSSNSIYLNRRARNCLIPSNFLFMLFNS